MLQVEHTTEDRERSVDTRREAVESDEEANVYHHAKRVSIYCREDVIHEQVSSKNCSIYS